MKFFLISFFGLLLFSCASSKKESKTINSLALTTENVQYYNEQIGFKIETIISDSRCPEGVQCIRLGEVELFIGVYDENKKIEEVQLTIDYKNLEKNKLFFESKILNNRNIAAISILPKKVEGQTIATKDYQLKIDFIP